MSQFTVGSRQFDSWEAAQQFAKTQATENGKAVELVKVGGKTYLIQPRPARRPVAQTITISREEFDALVARVAALETKPKRAPRKAA
jgi:hypothetical protein